MGLSSDLIDYKWEITSGMFQWHWPTIVFWLVARLYFFSWLIGFHCRFLAMACPQAILLQGEMLQSGRTGIVWSRRCIKFRIRQLLSPHFTVCEGWLSHDIYWGELLVAITFVAMLSFRIYVLIFILFMGIPICSMSMCRILANIHQHLPPMTQFCR